MKSIHWSAIPLKPLTDEVSLIVSYNSMRQGGHVSGFLNKFNNPSNKGQIVMSQNIGKRQVLWPHCEN